MERGQAEAISNHVAPVDSQQCPTLRAGVPSSLHLGGGASPPQAQGRYTFPRWSHCRLRRRTSAGTPSGPLRNPAPVGARRGPTSPHIGIIILGRASTPAGRSHGPCRAPSGGAQPPQTPPTAGSLPVHSILHRRYLPRKTGTVRACPFYPFAGARPSSWRCQLLRCATALRVTDARYGVPWALPRLQGARFEASTTMKG